MRTLRIQYGNRRNQGRPRSPTRLKDWPIRDLPWRGYPFMNACMYASQYTAELRRSFAKALVSHNGPKNALPSRLVASCVAQLAASPCESSLILNLGVNLLYGRPTFIIFWSRHNEQNEKIFASYRSSMKKLPPPKKKKKKKKNRERHKLTINLKYFIQLYLKGTV